MKKVHIKFITLIMCAILIINNIIFCTTVYAAAAAPAIGIPVGVGIDISSLPQDIYKGFKDAYNMFINDIFGLSNSYSYTDYDGVTKTATASTVKARGSSLIDSGKVMLDSNGDGLISLVYYDESSQSDVYVDFTLKEYAKFLTFAKVEIDVDTYNGENVVSFYYSVSDYEKAVQNVQAEFVFDDVVDDSSSGSAPTVTITYEPIKGIPGYEVTHSSDIKISCLDYLNLDYTAFLTFNDLFLENYNFRGDVSGSSSSYYTFFAITSDKELYILRSYFRIVGSRSVPSYNYFALSHNYVSSSPTFSYDSIYDYRLHQAFRFFEYEGRLFPCLYFSGYSYGGSYKKVQYTYGNPALSDTFNLFSDDSEFYDGLVFSPTPVFEFKNIQLQNAYTTFLEPKTQSIISDTDLLNKKISVVGYFENNSFDTIKFDSNNFVTAANLLPNYDTIYTGGTKTLTGQFSDLQKAIYILSQQYGESYEELLQKLNMIIDSAGNITITGTDGIKYSVDQLSKSFDDIFSKVADINQSTTDLLEYLKSLNIEGLGSYIAALEGTLDQLNERDKDRESVYGDILGKLDSLNDKLGSLGLDQLGSISSDISEIKDKINTGLIVGAIDIDDILNDNDLESSIFIEKFPFSLPFDLYRLITLFVREPVEPVFKVPIKTEITAFGLNESIDEEITLDLTMFKINGVDIVQVVLQFSITVGFIAMLIKSTTKLFV